MRGQRWWEWESGWALVRVWARLLVMRRKSLTTSFRGCRRRLLLLWAVRLARSRVQRLEGQRIFFAGRFFIGGLSARLAGEMFGDFGSGKLDLFAGGEGFYGCGSGCYFVFAEEDDVAGQGVGYVEGLAELEGAVAYFYR